RPMSDQDLANFPSREPPPSFTGLLYTTFLEMIDTTLSPRSYLEIGTNTGESLTRFRCNSICIDPEFRLKGNPIGSKEFVAFFQLSSDRFFATYDVKAYFPGGVDVAFLDGMHRFEYLLRDFLNTERVCH